MRETDTDTGDVQIKHRCFSQKFQPYRTGWIFSVMKNCGASLNATACANRQINTFRILFTNTSKTLQNLQTVCVCVLTSEIHLHFLCCDIDNQRDWLYGSFTLLQVKSSQAHPQVLLLGVAWPLRFLRSPWKQPICSNLPRSVSGSDFSFLPPF